MNDLVAAVVFFGVGYWVGSRRPGSLGAEIPMGSNALRYDTSLRTTTVPW